MKINYINKFYDRIITESGYIDECDPNPNTRSGCAGWLAIVALFLIVKLFVV
jgi:hypothetical protein